MSKEEMAETEAKHRYNEVNESLSRLDLRMILRKIKDANEQDIAHCERLLSSVVFTIETRLSEKTVCPKCKGDNLAGTSRGMECGDCGSEWVSHDS